MTRRLVTRVGSDERVYLLSASRQVMYALLYLGRFSLLVFLILVTGMWWWASAILIAFLLAGALIGFPRHYFGFGVITSSEGLRYIPRQGEERIVRWREVSAYRFGGMWVNLLNDEGEIRFLFSRPLLVKDAGELRREIVERCTGGSQAVSPWLRARRPPLWQASPSKCSAVRVQQIGNPATALGVR